VLLVFGAEHVVAAVTHRFRIFAIARFEVGGSSATRSLPRDQDTKEDTETQQSGHMSTFGTDVINGRSSAKDGVLERSGTGQSIRR